MKKLAIGFAIVLVLLLAIAAALPFLIDANRFRPLLEAELGRALNREVRLAGIEVALRQGGISASGLTISEDPAFGKKLFLSAKALRIEVEMKPLIFDRKLNILGLAIDQPEIALIQKPSGEWNFASLGVKNGGASGSAKPEEKPAGMQMTVRNIRVIGGRVTITDHSAGTPQAVEKLNIDWKEFAPQTSMPFTLSAEIPGGGGDFQLNGKVGPIDAADASRTPLQAALKASKVNLQTSGLLPAGSVAEGIAALDGTVESDGAKVSAKGVVRLEKAKLVKGGAVSPIPLALDFHLDHQLLRRSGTVRALQVHAGKAVANLKGTYAQQGAITKVDLDLSGANMPIPELLALLPVLRIQLPSGSSLEGGTASAKLSLEGPVGNLAIKGAAGLDNTRLSGFDLSGKMKTVARLAAGLVPSAHTEVQLFRADINDSGKGIDIEGLRLVAPGIGELTGAGHVGEDHSLDFKMRAVLETKGGVLAALGGSGNSTIPFRITGNAASPVFQPDVGGIATGILENRVKSGDVKKAVGGLLDQFLKPKQ